MGHSPDDRRRPLPFPKVKASKARGPRSPPIMTAHDGLPQHPIPEELIVAQGEKASDTKGDVGHWLPHATRHLMDSALRSRVDSLATVPSHSPPKTTSHLDDVALMNSPEREASPSNSNLSPAGKLGTLLQDEPPQFYDGSGRVEQAGSGQDGVVGIPVWKLPAEGVYELQAALPEPSPASDAEATPQSAPHCPETPSNDSSDTGEGDATKSDLFLGTGPSFRVSGMPIDSTANTTPTSPTLALRRNDSQPTGTSGLLGLHDARNGILVLLDRLVVIQETLRVKECESMYQSGRVSALEDVQEALLRRSELYHVGNAEGRILRREATNLDGMRYEAQSEGQRALGMDNKSQSPSLVTQMLHEAIVEIFNQAHGELQTVGKKTGEAASNCTSPGTTADAATRIAQYPAWKDHHLVSLTSERRVLQSQVERLEKENEQQRGDILGLQKQLEELRRPASIISGRDVPYSLVPGPPVPLLSLQHVRMESSSA